MLRQLVAHACDMLGVPTHSYSADVWQATKTQARSPELIVEYVPTRMHDNGKGERTGCLLTLDREARLWHHRKQLLISEDRLHVDWYDRKQRRLMLENVFGNGGVKYVAIVVLQEIGASSCAVVDHRCTVCPTTQGRALPTCGHIDKSCPCPSLHVVSTIQPSGNPVAAVG